MTALRLLHLYASALGINGDAGNVLSLRQRLQWRGIAADLVLVEAGQPMPNDVDLVHIGSGPRSARDALFDDMRGRAEALQGWAAAGVPMIGVGAGCQLLARSVVAIDGTEYAGASVLPITIRDIATRAVGEVLGTPAEGYRMAGYLNHAVEVERHGAAALVELDRGPATSPSDTSGQRSDGVRAGALVGTHLHGPVLPMNPLLADDLLRHALARHGDTLPAPDERVLAVDESARRSRASIAARLGRAGVEV